MAVTFVFACLVVVFNLLADIIYGCLTHASPTVDVAVPFEGRPRRTSRGFEAWRKFRRHRMAVASVVILTLLTSAVALGPFIWRVPITKSISRRGSPRRRGSTRFGTTISVRTCWRACCTADVFPLAVGFAAMAVAIIAGTLIGAISGISRAASTPC